jgi:hypothetical protein
MPHYYFDHEIDGTTVRDDEGVTLQSLAVARDEAALMIVALAKAKGHHRRDSRVLVREGDGPALLVASLQLRVELISS